MLIREDFQGYPFLVGGVPPTEAVGATALWSAVSTTTFDGTSIQLDITATDLEYDVEFVLDLSAPQGHASGTVLMQARTTLQGVSGLILSGAPAIAQLGGIATIAAGDTAAGAFLGAYIAGNSTALQCVLRIERRSSGYRFFVDGVEAAASISGTGTVASPWALTQVLIVWKFDAGAVISQVTPKSLTVNDPASNLAVPPNYYFMRDEFRGTGGVRGRTPTILQHVAGTWDVYDDASLGRDYTLSNPGTVLAPFDGSDSFPGSALSIFLTGEPSGTYDSYFEVRVVNFTAATPFNFVATNVAGPALITGSMPSLHTNTLPTGTFVVRATKVGSSVIWTVNGTTPDPLVFSTSGAPTLPHLTGLSVASYNNIGETGPLVEYVEMGAQIPGGVGYTPWSAFWQDLVGTQEAVGTSTLTKPTAVVPGTQGVMGSAGSPAIPAYTSTETINVCGFEPGGGVTLTTIGNGLNPLIFKPTFGPAQTFPGPMNWVCHPTQVSTFHPAVPATPPVPGTPGTPDQIIQSQPSWLDGAITVGTLPLKTGAQAYVPSALEFSVPSLTPGIHLRLIADPSHPDVVVADFLIQNNAVYLDGIVLGAVDLGADARWQLVVQHDAVALVGDGLIFGTKEILPGSYYVAVSLYTALDTIVTPVMLRSVIYQPGVNDGLFLLSPSAPALESFVADNHAILALAPLKVRGGTSARQSGKFALRPLALTAGQIPPLKLRPLAVFGSNYATAQAKLTLASVTGGGAEDPFAPRINFGAPALGLMTMAGRSLTGGIGGANLTLRSVDALGGRPIGQAWVKLQPLLAGGTAYEGNGNASMGAAALATADVLADLILFVTMNSTGTITSTFAAEVLWDMQLVSTATGTSTSTVDFLYEALLVSYANAASIDPQSQEASQVWAINLDTPASTRYENFSFNSFAVINGKGYGARADGLYLLDGDTDSGAKIQASVKTGRTNMNTPMVKRLESAYIAASSTGTLYLKVTDADGQVYTFAARRSSTKLEQQRIDVGRGVQANFLTFELVNQGADFELNGLEFNAVALTRKIR